LLDCITILLYHLVSLRYKIARKWFLLFSYCVISSVNLYIVFWDFMLLYAIISSILLCYDLCIVPYIKPNNPLNSSLGKLLGQAYYICNYLLISPISHKNSYSKIAMQHYKFTISYSFCGYIELCVRKKFEVKLINDDSQSCINEHHKRRWIRDLPKCFNHLYQRDILS
jgi:hypothetical protein